MSGSSGRGAAAPILLGIDGGNTKTLALASAPDGTILGVSRVVRGSDIHSVPLETALAVYDDAVGQALAGIDVVTPEDVTVAASLAGADWPEDVALLEAHLRERWRSTTVVNDAIGALRGAVPDGPAVVVVTGTGTATGARGRDGRTWHSGFWQEVQGAHELGVRAIQAIVRAELGIDPPTRLTAAVVAAAGEHDVGAVLHRLSRRRVATDGARWDPAVLAPVLLGLADDGDPTAGAIVDRHGRALGAMALAAARQVGIGPDDPFDLALTGGVLRRHRGRLRAALLGEVERGARRVRVVEPAAEPVVGALLLAFDAAGIPTDAAIVDRIRAGAREVEAPSALEPR
ncbi:MAG TPA: BadF/BadG/BcrA/BcrD ATPase family protein [Candidatus Limnocylindrales bacterium]|nr:BadF/BadG/BcrA/BcrD ATPase family protein [Candidatus Limnocylindrales bacterium]